MQSHSTQSADVYRYVPPAQTIARAVTYIGDVLLEFSLRLSGSVLVTCVEDSTGAPTEQRAGLLVAGAALHRIADGLYVNAVRGDRPTIMSAGGHRFTHSGGRLSGPRTKRFSGECAIDIPGGHNADEPAVNGSLAYTLDVTAAAPSDPVTTARGDRWSEHYDRSLASIGAVVLEPVPVTNERAARLYAT